MEPYTLNRNFIRQNVIDGFLSIIWTERYYGDSEVELVVPATSEMIKKLPKGIFLSLTGADEVMILETMNIEDGKLKLTGISLLPWMNNRFVRTSNKHEENHWVLEGGPAGWALWAIIYYMCVAGSPYLNGTISTGISNPQQLAIPGLGLKAYDTSGQNIKIDVPYGPVYDAMREIAVSAEIGMQITLESATESSYFLGFRSYKGLDRTSRQTINPIVRFSPQMESFTDIKELQSIAALKTLVYTFAPQLAEADRALATIPGEAKLTGTQYTGFDLRALLVLTDISSETISVADVPNAQVLQDLLMMRAQIALRENHFIVAVDGEIVPTNQFKYGVDYNLGDIIEVQGNSEVVQTVRVTEYIRAQDEAGERAYPTVAILG